MNHDNDIQDKMIELELEPIRRLSRDLRKAAQDLSPQEARYLVDLYYVIQNYRIRSSNQVRAMSEDREPNTLILWSQDTFKSIESSIRGAMGEFAKSKPVGEWSLSICGIGPVLAAGLLAHIDIDRVENAAQIWSFAGLSPNVTWDKGKKRPWNARLKTLCWKIGESFVKVQNREADYYGKFYIERKFKEGTTNSHKGFQDQAEAKLAKFKIGKTTEAYKWYSQGMLPPAHIHARAKRYAVKLFLAHWFEVAWRSKHGTSPEPPRPFAIEHLGHTKIIPVPNFD